MGLESLEDYVCSNHEGLKGIPWISSAYSRERQVFLRSMLQLGIETISEDNRIFYGYDGDDHFSFKLPASEKLQVFSNLLALFEIHKDVTGQRIRSEKGLPMGWYFVWPTQVEEGTSLQTLKEDEISREWYYEAPPTLMYYYDKGRIILLNPYLEELDLEGLANKINRNVFFNPQYRFLDLQDYTDTGCLFYLGRDLFGKSFKTLNYPQSTL